jgi:hypothetical protein
LSASKNGEFSFSEVVFVPHKANNDETIFVGITMGSGKFLRATPRHLLLDCASNLVFASSLQVGSCLQTANGPETIVALKISKGYGVQTVVVMSNEFVVVGGIVASPFAVSHDVVNAFYNIHRFIFKIYPPLLEFDWAVSTNAFVGSAALMAMQMFDSEV